MGLENSVIKFSIVDTTIPIMERGVLALYLVKFIPIFDNHIDLCVLAERGEYRATKFGKLSHQG